MKSSQEVGIWGEQRAREYLENRDYAFIAANWSCKAGELDLIMKHHSEIVFVEVRLRRATNFGDGFETVAWQKQRKLIRAAQWYLAATHQQNLVARFDVISIIHEEGQSPTIEHIDHAFDVY